MPLFGFSRIFSNSTTKFSIPPDTSENSSSDPSSSIQTLFYISDIYIKDSKSIEHRYHLPFKYSIFSYEEFLQNIVDEEEYQLQLESHYEITYSSVVCYKNYNFKIYIHKYEPGNSKDKKNKRNIIETKLDFRLLKQLLKRLLEQKIKKA